MNKENNNVIWKLIFQALSFFKQAKPFIHKLKIIDSRIEPSRKSSV